MGKIWEIWGNCGLLHNCWVLWPHGNATVPCWFNDVWSVQAKIVLNLNFKTFIQAHC